MQKAATVDGQELAEHAQSATQSQQFKTLDDSKSQLMQDGDSGNNLNKNLNMGGSQSDRNSMPGGGQLSGAEIAAAADGSGTNLVNQTSEAGM